MVCLVTFPFVSSTSKLEKTSQEEASFCKKPESKLAMHMKKVKISLKCSSSKRDMMEVKMIKKVEDSSANFGAAADAEEDKFFNLFIEGVLKNLYLPEHSDVIKYQHWKHVAQCSLMKLFPDPSDVYVKPDESLEKEKEELSFFEFMNDDEQIGRIILMEKEFAYFLDDKEMERMKYYDVIQKKKEKLKEEAEEKKKLKEEAEEKK